MILNFRKSLKFAVTALLLFLTGALQTAPAQSPAMLKAQQAQGGGAMSQEGPLSFMWARMRALRFADGPDEVHRQQIARLELRRHNYKSKAARIAG